MNYITDFKITEGNATRIYETYGDVINPRVQYIEGNKITIKIVYETKEGK